MKLTGTIRRFVFMPGRPAPSQPGQFLGLDAQGGLYVLRWDEGQGCYAALGFDTGYRHREVAPRDWPHLVALKDDKATLIVSHAAGPELAEEVPGHG